MNVPIDLLLGARGRPHHAANRPHQFGPARFLADELLLAIGRELVELGALVGLGLPPLRADPAALGQPLQRRIERAGLDLQHVGRLGADRLGNRIAVLRPPPQDPQDQHVEGAGKQVGAGVVTRGVQGHGCRETTA
jgi:hypothetical protein